jgi:hypothetical protein
MRRGRYPRELLASKRRAVSAFRKLNLSDQQRMLKSTRNNALKK